MDRQKLVDKIIECGEILSKEAVKSPWWICKEEDLRHDPWNLHDEQIQRLKDKQPEWHKDHPGCVVIILD